MTPLWFSSYSHARKPAHYCLTNKTLVIKKASVCWSFTFGGPRTLRPKNLTVSGAAVPLFKAAAAPFAQDAGSRRSWARVDVKSFADSTIWAVAT